MSGAGKGPSGTSNHRTMNGTTHGASGNAAVPHLIGLDWGTTRLRAFLMGADGTVLQTRDAADGVQALAGGGAAAFDAALSRIVDGWPVLPRVACGMVGSAQGWQEVPYAATPADAAALVAGATTVATAGGVPLLVAPGVRHWPQGAAPDVMRGEETQVMGALRREPHPHALFVLPGTHSKWVVVEQGRIVSLRTAMTGEVFALLRTHSILGRLMAPDAGDADDTAGFDRGVQAARSADAAGDLLHGLFSTRTLALMGELPPAQGAGYLSGLLVGSELQAMLARAPAAVPLLLVGDDALCRRYARALQQAGRPAAAVLGNTAPDGLAALARAAGLLA